MTDFERARKLMVDNQLRTSNVTDRRVLLAMGHVPRERFVPDARQALAYIDEDVPLTAAANPRFLSAPAPFAKLLQLVGIDHADHVLDLGCGTGYSTAVLAYLSQHVTGVENDPSLAHAARDNLSALQVTNASIVEGPLDAAPKGTAPFDVIVVEGAVPAVPDQLFDALREGGRLVALVSSGPTAVAHLFVKSGRDVAGRADFNAKLPALATPRPAEEFVF